MNLCDTVSLLCFSGKTTWLFKNEGIDGNRNTLTRRVHDVSVVHKGSTAFYYAMCEAIKHCKNDNTWIVALTDGEDNQSRKLYRTTPNTVIDTAKKYSSSLIVITVGELRNMHEIKNIVKTTSGIHIDVNDSTDGIKMAFVKAINIINRGQVNIEML